MIKPIDLKNRRISIGQDRLFVFADGNNRLIAIPENKIEMVREPPELETTGSDRVYFYVNKEQVAGDIREFIDVLRDSTKEWDHPPQIKKDDYDDVPF